MMEEIEEIAANASDYEGFAVDIRLAHDAPVTAEPAPIVQARAPLALMVPVGHGLRVSEVEALRSNAIDYDQLSFYRKKTDTHQVHQLTPRSQPIAAAYLEKDGAAR